jgi:Recombinase/Recombinase zinc beta ribbon domain/Enoyl-CoA hydratase/isomerase
MKENARQGFWNGALPPIGYRIVEASEQRGHRTKKTLEIDPVQAETVRFIFRLAREGNGSSGPMGVKSIATHLNAIGIRTRDGGRWGVDAVHKVLTRTTYVGRHRFNTKFWKTRERKAETEIVEMAVPAIVDKDEFEAVQMLLQSRSPAMTAPRIVSGPTLLTGICLCAACGGAMTLRTGKSGRYRYYTCCTKARQGETGCPGRTVPMEKLDNLVAEYIEQRLLQPTWLEQLLSHVLNRRTERAERRRSHIAELRSPSFLDGAKRGLMTKEFTRIVYENAAPHVARIILNRPDTRNAQDALLLYELNEAFDLAAQDNDVKVIILAANGPHFSSGHDLRDVGQIDTLEKFRTVGTWGGFRGEGGEGRTAFEKEAFLGFSERWRNIPKPTIAQVQGKAIAGALLLIWPCDLIMASDDAQSRTTRSAWPSTEWSSSAILMSSVCAKPRMLFRSSWISATKRTA